MDQEGVVAVGADDGYRKVRGQGPHGADVVHVAVGQEDALGGEVEPSQKLQDQLGLSAGVDDRRAPRPLAP